MAIKVKKSGSKIAIAFGKSTVRHVSVDEAYRLGNDLIKAVFADAAARMTAEAKIRALVRKHRVAVVTSIQRRRRR